jgi:hypothetical protein
MDETAAGAAAASKEEPMRSAGILAILSTFVLAAPAVSAGLKLGSGFTFQGRLERGAAPARGAFDFELELYDQREGGTLLGAQTVFDSAVEGGVFSLELDFGRVVLDAAEAWLEIRVREAGNGPFTPLLPRQPVSATTTSTCVVDSLAVVNTAGVGMSTAPASAQLEVRGPESNGISTAGLMVKSGSGLGAQTLFVDGDEIDVGSLGNVLNLNRNVPGDVTLAAGGGNVGVGVTAPEARLHLPGSPDAEPGSGGALVVGNLTGANVTLDANEIMARNNGAVATLSLNNDGGDVATGGDVNVGGTLDFGYQIVSSAGCSGPSAWVDCPAGTKVIGGGCSGHSPVWQSYPTDVGGSLGPGDERWRCRWEECTYPSDIAVAICARVE